MRGICKLCFLLFTIERPLLNKPASRWWCFLSEHFSELADNIRYISTTTNRSTRFDQFLSVTQLNNTYHRMVGEMVQNSQSLHSFTFSAVIVIHEYIYSHSTANFTLKKYIYSYLMMYFLFTNIFTRIYEIYSFTFNGLYSFTFTIEIFIHHFLRTALCASLGPSFRSIISERNMADEG